MAAELLQLTPELLGLAPSASQGSGFRQHQQQPGRLALLPLLGQMQELRGKVVAAAAELAALAIQVRPLACMPSMHMIVKPSCQQLCVHIHLDSLIAASPCPSC